MLEPHPNLPILATSGLDHDIKVWTPTATKPATLEDIKKVQPYRWGIYLFIMVAAILMSKRHFIKSCQTSEIL